MSALPVVIPIAYRDPVAAFAPCADGAMSILLQSALPGPQGRYSYIAVEPFRTLRCTPHPWHVSRDGQPCEGDPFAVLAQELARFSCDGVGPTPFAGGAIGFFSYELGGVLDGVLLAGAACSQSPGRDGFALQVGDR